MTAPVEGARDLPRELVATMIESFARIAAALETIALPSFQERRDNYNEAMNAVIAQLREFPSSIFHDGHVTPDFRARAERDPLARWVICSASEWTELEALRAELAAMRAELAKRGGKP